VTSLGDRVAAVVGARPVAWEARAGGYTASQLVVALDWARRELDLD
jgi:hypothetical protein